MHGLDAHEHVRMYAAIQAQLKHLYAYVSIRQLEHVRMYAAVQVQVKHLYAYVSICQHMSAYVSSRTRPNAQCCPITTETYTSSVRPHKLVA